jgi:DNA-binding PadR family transcriptional regulator
VKNPDKNQFRNKNIPTKFQYRVLNTIDRLRDPTKHDIYNKFSGGRSLSSVTSVLSTMKTKGWISASRNKKNRIEYSLTAKGQKVFSDVKNKKVKYVKSPTKFTKSGLCEKCHINIEELTRIKVRETPEGENIFEYWCRNCLCPDDDLCVERELAARSGHHLRTADDFETISAGDETLIEKALKKHGKGFKTRFGRI